MTAVQKMAIPSTPNELAELVTDRRKMTGIINSNDPTAWPRLLTNYANRVNNAGNGDVQRQIDEQMTRGLSSFLTANGIQPSLSAAQARNAMQSLNSPDAPGAKLNGMFSNIGKYLRAVWHDDQTPQGEEKRSQIRNAMSSTDPSSGGFLVPEEFRSELLRVSLESALVRPRATVLPMSTLRMAVPTVDATSNASSVFGGVVAYWTEEGAAMVQSQPKFGRVSLEAKKLTAYLEAPNELVNDAGATFTALVRQTVPAALAWYEDAAFLTGTGVGEPLGIFNPSSNLSAVVVAKEAGQAASTILWENIAAMYARMLPGSLNRAVWVASIDTFPQLATMALAVGTGGAPVWINNGQDGPPMTILGRPVIFSEKATALGGQGDIAFVDFSYYLIGDRQAMSVESSPHFKFSTDSTAYRFIERVDGRPWMQSPITPKNGSANTLSPYVALAARP